MSGVELSGVEMSGVELSGVEMSGVEMSNPPIFLVGKAPYLSIVHFIKKCVIFG